MRQFIHNILLFSGTLIIIIILIGKNYHIPRETSDYMGAIIDKHAFLEKTSAPRIIFIGGSNLAFGIDSKKIQDSIGLPVINLGNRGNTPSF